MNYKVVTGVTLNTRFMQDILKRVGAELIQLTLKTEADVMEHAADADGVIVGLEPYTQEGHRGHDPVQDHKPTGVGYSNIDVEEATRRESP